jgi:hypothetical protein
MVFSTTQSFISLYSMTPQLISDEERQCQEYQRRDMQIRERRQKYSASPPAASVGIGTVSFSNWNHGTNGTDEAGEPAMFNVFCF